MSMESRQEVEMTKTNIRIELMLLIVGIEIIQH